MRGLKKDIAFGVCLFLVSFLLPLFRINNDLGTLVSATSTVFAIVAGFFIADAMSNYLRLQTLIAEENASLISIADSVKKAGGDDSVNVHKAIDQYMIAQLNLGTLAHVFQTEKEVDQIGVAINAFTASPEGKECSDRIFDMKDKIISCRQEISLAAKNNLTAGHWIVLITLAILMATTILTIRDGSLLMNLIVGLMIIGTQAVLVLLREMDNNHLLEKKLAYENPREVFHAISQPPYYPHFSPLHSRLPNEAGLYRLGREETTPEDPWDIINASKA